MTFVSGLASGIDTESLIKQLIDLERKPITLMRSRQLAFEQKRDAYRDVNTRMRNLVNVLDSLTGLSAFQSKKLASSNAEVATGTATLGATPGSYDLDVTQLARIHRVASDQQADSTSGLGLSGTIGINGTNVAITADMSLSDVRTAITDAKAGAVATILNDTLVIESTSSGDANALVLSDESGSVLEQLGVLDGGGNIQHELQAAQDAQFTLNGIAFSRSSNTVNDAVSGITFALLSEGNTTITVTQDTQKAVDEIQKFVDQYNSTQDFIGSKIEKEATLQGDATLIRLYSRINILSMDRVETGSANGFTSLAAIGVSVDKDGVMTLDQSKLRTALENHPDEVRLLLQGTADQDGFDGVATRLRNYARSFTQTGTGILSVRQSMFEDQMNALQDSMDRVEQRLQAREAFLVRQFTEMEKAISSMQNLSVALSGQITQMMNMAG